MRSPTITFGSIEYVANGNLVSTDAGGMVADAGSPELAKIVADSLNLRLGVIRMFKEYDEENMNAFDDALEALRPLAGVPLY